MSERPAAFDGQPWAPVTYTAPLRPDFDSAADGLLPFVDAVWTHGTGQPLALDQWQRTLLRHVLELGPDGGLRYRQAVISVAKQNGKSLLAAVLGLWALLQRGSEVVGIATSTDQARIVYSRVAQQIDTTPALSRRYSTTTVSARGIQSRDSSRPGSYIVKAGNPKSVQGTPIWPLCIADELHLWNPDVWDVLLLQTSATGGSLFGITTAGDETSALLDRLYKIGKAAARGDEGSDDRFGLFLWEAPASAPVDDPDALRAANPAIACGRLPIEPEIQAVRQMPENQARRYRLNTFVSATASWLPLTVWTGLPRDPVPTEAAELVVSVARDNGWRNATVAVAATVGDQVRVELAASIVEPTLDGLEAIVLELWHRWEPAAIVMPTATLRELHQRLKDQGAPSRYLMQAELMRAAALADSLIRQSRVAHDGSPLLLQQIPKAVARNSGEGWLISRRHSLGPIDAVEAMLASVYVAESYRAPAPALQVV